LESGLDSPRSSGTRRFKVLPKKEAEKVKEKRLAKQKEVDHLFLDGEISQQEYERRRTGG
jgi:hypothetical protein